MSRLHIVGSALVVVSCGGNIDGVTAKETQDPGVQAPAAPRDPNTNPDGVPYPTSNVGTSTHTRIPNFKLMGFRAKDTASIVDTTGGLTTLAMSDYYDPLGTRGIKLVHVSVNVRWCSPSNQQVSWLSGYDHQSNQRTGSGVAAQLASEGVVFMDVLVEGFAPGTTATLDDLRGWVQDHQINFDAAIDSSYGELGSLFNQAAIPFNVIIDARSMEIEQTSVGFSADETTTIRKWLDWTKVHPPMAN